MWFILLGLIIFFYSFEQYEIKPDFYHELGQIGFWLIILGVILCLM